MSRTRAFDDIAGLYEEHRPRYPEPVLRVLLESVKLADSPWLLLDVGSGTGISARQLRETFGPGPRIVAIEPGPGMRSIARASTPRELEIDFVGATAEALPLPDSRASLVFAAQSLHWFDRPAFYREARRVLVPGATLALVESNRRWDRSDFLACYESYLEAHSPGYSRTYRAFDILQELAATPGFLPSPPLRHSWLRRLTWDEFVGMSFSSSKMKAVVDRRGASRVRIELREFLSPEEELEIPYETCLHLARKEPAQ